jgi:quercetin dioxygenase-like cupin family protein
MQNTRLIRAMVVASALAAFAGAVYATAGSGAVGNELARAHFTNETDLKFLIRHDNGGHDNIQVHGAAETVVQQIVFAPNGYSGWHSHPGPAVAVIKSGELTLYDGDDQTCAGRTYTAGEAFIDPGQGHVHFAQNQSQTQSSEVWVTYFDVPLGASARIDEPAPGNCPF